MRIRFPTGLLLADWTAERPMLRFMIRSGKSGRNVRREKLPKSAVKPLIERCEKLALEGSDSAWEIFE